MAKYRFDQIAINSTEKKKPAEEDRFTYLGLEHLDSGTLKVTRFGSEVAPIGEKLVMHKGDVLFGKRRAYQKKVAIFVSSRRSKAATVTISWASSQKSVLSRSGPCPSSPDYGESKKHTTISKSASMPFWMMPPTRCSPCSESSIR